MKRPLLIISLSFLFIGVNCNAQNYAAQKASSVPSNVIMDVQHNVPAYQFDIPKAYQLSGKVYWANQAELYLPNCMGNVTNSSNGANIELLPSALFKYVQGQELEMYMQQMGMPNVAPLATAQTMEQVLLGHIQKIHGSIQMQGGQALPNLERDFWPSEANPSITSDGYKMQYSFQKNGQSHRAELYAIQYQTSQSYQGMYGINVYTLWGLGHVFEISAPAAQFDQVKNELLNIVKSGKKLPQWTELVRQIDQQKAREIDQMTQQSAVAHQQRMANNQRNFDATQQAYRSTQQAYDQSNQAWMNNQRSNDQGQTNYVNSIHGTEVYTDPNTGSQYNLDNPYQYNWTNGNGQVISTNDAFYNPEPNNAGTYYQLNPQNR